MLSLVLHGGGMRQVPAHMLLHWLDQGTPEEEAEFLRARRLIWDGDRPGCLAEYRDDGYTYVLAFVDGQPAGVAAEYEFEPGRYMVAATAVIPPFRRVTVLPQLFQAVGERVLGKANAVALLCEDGDQESVQAALAVGFRHEWLGCPQA